MSNLIVVKDDNGKDYDVLNVAQIESVKVELIADEHRVTVRFPSGDTKHYRGEPAKGIVDNLNQRVSRHSPGSV